MNNAVDAGNGSSADNVDAVVQIFQGVGNINIYKVALDAGQQIFSAVSFSVGTFMINIYGPSGKMERIMKHCLKSQTVHCILPKKREKTGLSYMIRKNTDIC